MPPLPPIQALPPQLTTRYIVEPLDADNRKSMVVVPSPMHAFGRPMSLSFSSTSSAMTGSTTMSNSTLSTRTRTSSAPLSYTTGASSFSLGSLLVAEEEFVDITTQPVKRFMLDSSLIESEISALPPSLFPLEQLESLSERSLAMHLYRSYQIVLACQEAMWEELKDRIRNKKDELLPFGWDDDEELEELQSRKKFERLIERYQS